ncbi:hypothetical protein JCM11491_001847 [Sporobolomyces phaffii]
MKLKQPDYPPPGPAHAAGGDAWDSLAHQLDALSPGTQEPAPGDASESPKLDNDRDLSTIQLADSALDNVVSCIDCNKPVLQASLADHQAICPNSKNPQNLKRKLSEGKSSRHLRDHLKSKITLHFNNSATNSPDPAASNSPVPSLASAHTPSSAPVPGSTTTTTAPSASAAAIDKKNKRTVDPDRQCGVINERGLPCQRSLTCKTHNMTAKRAVPHRSQPFDSLLLEWQKASRLGKEREALSKSMREGGPPALGGGVAPGYGAGGPPIGANGMPNFLGQPAIGDESFAAGGGPGGGPTAGKKEKRKKNANSATTANGGGAYGTLPGLDPTQDPSLLPPTTGKKSKKPNANSNSASNGQTVYYVGEAPPPSSTAGNRAGGAGELEEEEESDYLSSSDEVESVLLSLQKLTRRNLDRPASSNAVVGFGSPLVGREGGGSGFSSASWFTGRNRKLMRLRNLGLDAVFGGGSNASSGSTAGNGKR